MTFLHNNMDARMRQDKTQEKIILINIYNKEQER